MQWLRQNKGGFRFVRKLRTKKCWKLDFLFYENKNFACYLLLFKSEVMYMPIYLDYL